MLELGGFQVRAVSVGGMETCIEVPAWRLCFDIGRCPPTAVRLATVLFTHAHCDHMGGVAHHCSQRDLLRMPPPEYVVPNENLEAFNDLLSAWRRLDRSDLPCKVRGVSPGDVVPLGSNRYARVFRAVHRVPALGYAICRTVKRLRLQYRDLPGPQLAELRAQGVEINDEHEAVELAFCGDTTVDVIDREALVREAKVLLLEVTFLDDRVPVEKARAQGHVHLDELLPRLDLLRNEAILFTHFSLRYSRNELVRILDERVPAAHRGRIQALLPEPPWVGSA